jgi:L-amino acid N-acyltransferase YncA
MSAVPTAHSLRITLADRVDVAAMLAISNDAAVRTPANFATTPEPLADWEAWFDQGHAAYPWLVAWDGERIVGFARGSAHRARGAYAWSAEVSVYVAFDTHARGVGTRLYERLIPTLRAQGYVTLLAGITIGNPASERLHERFGFVRCATYHRVGWKNGAWHDVGYWELHTTVADEAPGPIKLVREVWNEGARE